MLALPLQAFASATLLGCMVSLQPAEERMAMADGDMADATMAGCHEHGQPDAPPTQHNCKHCAACALASALPVPIIESPAIVPITKSFVAQPAESFSGFIPDGPERPPQASLA